MQYTLSQIAEITNGELIGPDSVVSRFTTDSRTLKSPEELFIAIKGVNFDGHDFIENAYNKGARAFLVSRKTSLVDVSFVVVDNTVEALQKIAEFHRSKFDIPVIGITGSNGKTIVKEWLYHVLRDKYRICRSPKSFNSQIGVPLSVLQLRAHHELAIFEAGISEPGEMTSLAQVIKPTMGIFTHYGSAHAGNFNDLDHLYSEKKKLFESTDKVLYPLEFEMERLKNETRISLDGENYTVPFIEDSAIQNCATVIRMARLLGMFSAGIQEKISSLPSVAMRLERRIGKNGSTLLNDSYSSDLSSLRNSLSQLAQYKGKKAVILSSISTDHLVSDELYDEVYEELNKLDLDQLVLIGKKICRFVDKATCSEVFAFTSVEEFLDHIDGFNFTDTTVLIKGARSFKFEKIVLRLEEKPHSTWMEVNLSALSTNIQAYRKRVGDVKLMVMIKAMSYGAGGSELTEFLSDQNVDYFGVAYALEGIEVRELGCKVPVMVLNADYHAFEDIIQHNLEPVIHSIRQLGQFIEFTEVKGVEDYPIHLEIDTGMRRLGLETHQVVEVCELIQQSHAVKVASVFSHLAAADNPGYKAFTRSQIEKLIDTSDMIEHILGYVHMKHICNTSGIENFPEAHLDMVRLGIGLHGIGNLPDLRPAERLLSRVTQIKTIEAGETIGYGCSERVENTTRIGILPLGYADGIARLLSNGAGQFIHEKSGKSCPIIGRVCMDMTMIRIPEEVDEDDIIEIFGHLQPLEQFAKMLNTIPYEVLTSISDRVNRIYTVD